MTTTEIDAAKAIDAAKTSPETAPKTRGPRRTTQLRSQATDIVKAWDADRRRAETAEAALARIETILVDALTKVRRILGEIEPAETED